MVIDTHSHVSPYWFEPVETLLFQMESHGVDKAVLVQCRGQTDNTYLFQCIRRFPGRFCAVVIVDTQGSGALADLERLAADGASGIRLNPSTRSPGQDSLAIWRKAEELGLAVSSRGSIEEFSSTKFRDLLQEVPELSVVMEHLGGVGANASSPYTLYNRVLSLSDYPNTYIKVHGLGEICTRPLRFSQPFPFEAVPPLVNMAYEAFGSRRMMWGSDYPPVSGREGYQNSLQFPMDYYTFLTEEDRGWVFGGTAQRVFRFDLL